MVFRPRRAPIRPSCQTSMVLTAKGQGTSFSSTGAPSQQWSAWSWLHSTRLAETAGRSRPGT